MSRTIKLNVGGKIFETTESTLHKSTYLKNLLTYHDKSKEIFIDRCYKNFKHVLALLRDTQHIFPVELNYELMFYGIDFVPIDVKDEMTEKINNSREFLNNNITIIANKVNEIVNLLDSDDVRVHAIPICADCDEFLENSYDLYCDNHAVCGKEDCTNWRYEDSSYCENHSICEVLYCNRQKQGIDYCAEHKCDKSFCNNLKVDNTNFCKDHHYCR